MGRISVGLLIVSIIGAVYYYNKNPWYSLLLMGLFAAVLYDAKTR